MATSRVRRGRKTQELLAEWFNNRGWFQARSRPASLPGMDIEGMPGWAPEVKATRDGSLTAAVRQAVKNAENDTPFVVWRPDGYGPEKIDQWLVVLPLGVFTPMMRELEGWAGE
ncbi:hypothetical protein [Phytoactinopolyspora halophila]|uniref:hypothetical protein n=1 Tax=Phytoactinopolyspora halophila TaxID=1981511 RepID=UPI000F4DBBC2|nr:hypothetical protein [Phytoactinopolyspora halophila]